MRTFLSKVPFNTREPGPMKVVADVADYDYCIKSATIELSQPNPDLLKVARLITIAEVLGGPSQK